MKNEYILVLVLVLAVGAFYYFATRKPSLSVQLLDNQGNIAAKGTPENPVTSADIQSVTELLNRLLELKANQKA